MSKNASDDVPGSSGLTTATGGVSVDEVFATTASSDEAAIGCVEAEERQTALEHGRSDATRTNRAARVQGTVVEIFF